MAGCFWRWGPWFVCGVNRAGNGVVNVVAIDLDDDKLAAAREQGAKAVLNPSEVKDAPAELQEIAGGNVLAALDTVGAEATAHLAVNALKKTGRLVIVGLHGGRFSIPLPFFPQRAMTVRGSYVGSVQELRELVALVREGRMKPIPVATRPMADADQTLKDLEAGKIVGRVVLSTE